MKRALILLCLFTSIPAAYAGNPLQKGDKVPDFQAVDDQGNAWKLSDQRADYLVIYFYPAAFTGGCTKEACSYRDDHSKFALLNTKVIGISGDRQENLEAFKEHHNLNFTLLSDADGNIANLFGVPVSDGGTIDMDVEGEQMSLTRGVTANRWTFVVDVNGKLIYKDEHVKAAEDSGEVLKFIATYDKRRSCTNF